MTKMFGRLTSVLGALSLVTLTACGGGGGNGVGPIPTVSPTPTSSPIVPQADAGCPSSASTAAVERQSYIPGQGQIVRRMPTAIRDQRTPQMFEVLYAPSAETGVRLAQTTGQMRGVQVLEFGRLGLRAQIFQVPAGSDLQSAMSKMRMQSGVRSVTPIHYRYKDSASALAVNDPYYAGFSGVTAPYYETAKIPGQWDMHVINVGQAWGYSKPNSGPSNVSAGIGGAIGGSATLAVIDTGADINALEMATYNGEPKVVLTKCFVTWNGKQTTGQYVTDTDGHGTNVAGIAAADTNNGAGFVGVGYNTKLMIYRIFPTDPAGGCDTSSAQNSPQCASDTADEASAINDAVTNGARVINLSLGGSPNPGQTCAQNDPVESAAVENAIASGVTVVAASGNESSGTVDCPAGNAGVIAVGASALDDSNPSSITEKVASYSNYGAVNAADSTSSWGLVAPGGNPSGSGDSDDLHWILNVYSSTAADLGGPCGNDYAGVKECVVYMAGTSQATPHVAAAAALIADSTPYTPAQIFGMLCGTADNLNDSHQGCGRLNVYKAMAAALHDSNP